MSETINDQYMWYHRRSYANKAIINKDSIDIRETKVVLAND